MKPATDDCGAGTLERYSGFVFSSTVLCDKVRISSAMDRSLSTVLNKVTGNRPSP